MIISPEQQQRAQTFKDLHERSGLFIIPNPWDAGSAKILAGLGFGALATTSAGLAWMQGKPDSAGMVSRGQALANAREIAQATNLPVAADLENGYGDQPEFCAETIYLAAGAGLVGGSIEDATGNDDAPIYPFELSVERIRAAVQAARDLPFPFMLVARAENLIHGRPDLQDTIRRLEAYAEAGADVLFAPGLKTLDEVKAVVKAVAPKPVNVLFGPGLGFTIDELEQAGVRRVSLGSSLARAAYGAFYHTANRLRNEKIYSSPEALSYGDLNTLFKS